MAEMTPRELLLESIRLFERDYQMGYISIGELVRNVNGLTEDYHIRLAYDAAHAEKGADGEQVTNG